MSFFSSKPQQSGAAVQRKKQIDSLKARNPTIRMTKQDTYRVEIPTQFGKLPLQIYLAPNFPSVPPQIRLILGASVVHPWIVNQGNAIWVSKHPSIDRWSVHTDVGALVKQICDEFTRSPPKPAQMQPKQQVQPQRNYPGRHPVNPVPVPRGSNQGHPGMNQHIPTQQPRHVQPVPAPAPVPKPAPRTEEPSNNQFHVPNIPLPSFSAIEKKTPAELQIFLRQKPLRYKFMIDLEEVKNLESVKAGLYDGIEKIAKENLARESEIKEKVAELKELREQVEKKKNEYKPLGEKKQQILEKFTYKSIMKALDDAIEEKEEQSDKTRERYENIDNSESDSNSDDETLEELTHTKFTKIYTKERKKTHILLAKKERLITLYGEP